MDNIVAYRCQFFSVGTILNCIYYILNTFTYAIHINPMNRIKLFDGYIFIGKVDDVTVVVGTKHRPTFSVHNIMVARLCSVCYNSIPGTV